jgi:hypothetical protein
MFKYSSINSYSLRNLQKNQIYFNNPLNFNDPFDTFQPAIMSEISNEKFVEIFNKTSKRKFDTKSLLAILNKTISKEKLYEFCEEHAEYMFDFNIKDENQIFDSKEDFLKQINDSEESKNNSIDNISRFFQFIKQRLQTSVINNLHQMRKDSLSKIGVSCFSKNNSNLLMWSHYADSHRGMCLEFDSKAQPFSKSFEVLYKSKIPKINMDSLLNEELDSEFIINLLSFKSIDWKHEEELRIFHQESNKCYVYPSNSLKAIYFGLRADQSDIEIVCSIIKSQNPDVQFYRMEKKELTFGIEPKQFFYNTAVEVQTNLIVLIDKLFQKKEFSLNELFSKTKTGLSEKALKAHLEDLTLKNILSKKADKYKLTI